MKTSPEINSIAEALAKAQGEFQNPEKNRTVEVKTRTGGSYFFAYATLDQILEITRPILSKNGIAVVQVVEREPDLMLTSRVIHSSGQWIESSLPIHVEGDGVQALGSAISYLRRYGIISLLGLAAEEDDDGNRSDGNQARGQDRQPRQQQQPRQEERREAPKGQATAVASASAATKSGSLPSTKEPSGITDPRPSVFDPANPKTSCEEWYRSLKKAEGEKFGLAVWKYTNESWELRFHTIRDLVTACETIRKVMGDKPGSELIGGIVNGFTMDAEGLQQIRKELVRSSLGDVSMNLEA